MMNRKTILDDISTKLALIKEKLILENSVNDFSLNIHLENTYLKLLNELFDYNLKNANYFKKNHIAIDGIDEENGVYVQITSTSSVDKVITTIKKIQKTAIKDKCDTLLFIFLKGKTVFSKASKEKILKEINNDFKFDFDKNIIDNTDLFQHISFENNSSKIKNIKGILDEITGQIVEQQSPEFHSIAITFHNLEIENVLVLVKDFLKRNVVVYTSSYALIKRLESENIAIKNRIIYTLKNNLNSLERIDYFVSIISNEFIVENLKDSLIKSYECSILEYILKKEKDTKIYTFDHYLKNAKHIGLPQYKAYRTLDIDKYDVDFVINDLIKDTYETPFDIKKFKTAIIKNRAGFELVKEHFDSKLKYYHYQFKMPEFEENEINYLIVEKGYNQNEIVSHFKETYLNSIKHYAVLIPKNGLKTRTRINNFSKLLNIERVHFLDEYLFDTFLQKMQVAKVQNDESFINPIILDKTQHLGLNDILFWLTEDSETTISVLASAGGIGKTTVCEKIQYEITNRFERFIVIFIDPTTFINAFGNVNFNESLNYELYNVYKLCNSEDFLIEEDIFNINLNAGNIIIIFDGIDEVISTIESFSLNGFLERISKLKKQIGKGKILINCRDTYIQELRNYYDEKNLKEIHFYELLPFNKTLAKKYFEKRFPNETKKNKLAIRLLNNYLGLDVANNDYVYPPFVLETIGSYLEDEIIPNDSNDLTVDYFDFESELLIDTNLTDFIIFNVCKRENAKKKGNGFIILVDNQVKFMINLSVNQKGSIPTENIDWIFNDIGIRDRTDRLVDTIKDHPFLFFENNTYKFRFSFLKVHFEGIGIHKLFMDSEYFNDITYLIKTLAIRCNYNSLTFKNVEERIKNSKISYETLITKGKALIHAINEVLTINEMEKEKAISNLFIMLSKLANTLKYDCKTIIKDIFANSKGIVKGFYLIDIPPTCNLIFNFENTIFSFSKINNYQLFFSCNFDKDTSFYEDCEINKVLSKKLDFRNISATNDNFDTHIKGDNSIHTVLNLKENTRSQIEESMEAFFLTFRISAARNINEKRRFSDINSTYTGNIPIEIIIKALKETNIISKKNDKIIRLNKEKLKNIKNYILQGLEFRALKKAIELIMIEKLKNL